LGSSSPLLGKVVYVDDSAPGANDGTSWRDAFRDLGIAAQRSAEGDELRVAAGRYTPAFGTRDPLLSLLIRGGMKVRGGYAGFGTPDPDLRDITRFVTWVTGDHNGDDLGWENREDNAWRVLTCVDPGIVLEGLTVTGGKTDGALVVGDDNRVLDCTFEWNWGIYAGAIHIRNDDNVEIRRCTFRHNWGGRSGGAITVNACLNARIVDCTFVDNLQESTPDPPGYPGQPEGASSASLAGGAIAFDPEFSELTIEITGCTFRRNRSVHPPGVNAGVGGAIGGGGDLVILRDCYFEENEANYGGAVRLGGVGIATIEGCTFRGNRALVSAGLSMFSTDSATIRNCSFIENTATQFTGALGVLTLEGLVEDVVFIGNDGADEAGALWTGENLVVRGCTFEGNRARRAGAAYVKTGTCRFERCAFFGNEATAGPGGAVFSEAGGLEPRFFDTLFAGNRAGGFGGAVATTGSSYPQFDGCTFTLNDAGFRGGAFHTASGTAYATSSILWGNVPDEISGRTQVRYSIVSGGFTGEGNIEADPLFADPGGGDFRLSVDSPAIDRGLPAVADAETRRDLDGHSRVLCGRIDMGAHESGIGDADCDRDVDLIDYRKWPNCHGGPGVRVSPECAALDFDGDRDVDLVDFVRFEVALNNER
jgi:predicted outer membrane repeat protein